MIFGISSSSFQYEEGTQNSQFSNKSNIDGCKHKKYWKKDFDLLKKLGIQSYRFSIEWSSIEKKQGIISEKELVRYDKYLDFLNKNKIEPVLCLFHFSLPKWFEAKGGFLKEPELFLLFATNMIDYFKNKVKYFIVYNEPNVYANCAYLIGRWPPGQQNWFSYKKVLQNMQQVYNSILDQYSKEIYFGITMNVIPHYHKTFLNSMFDSIWNDCFLKNMSKKTKFVGINYYISRDTTWIDVFRRTEKDFFKKEESESNLGWPVDATGIDLAVEHIEKFIPKSVEIWITENGLSTKSEKDRCQFISNHVKHAIKNKKISRYYYWSLLDNWEWEYNNRAYFGLVKIGKNFKRMPKESFACYKKMIESYSKN